jgi:hypothetical protein
VHSYPGSREKYDPGICFLWSINSEKLDSRLSGQGIRGLSV